MVREELKTIEGALKKSSDQYQSEARSCFSSFISKKRNLRTLSFLAFFLFFNFCHASVFPKIPANYVIGRSFHAGFIIPHSPRVAHLAVSHPWGLEYNVQKKTLGNKEWHHLYNFPRVGVAVTYFDYRNPILGRSFAISPYLNKGIIRGDKHDLNFRLGTGLVYFTKTFDPVHNHKNMIVSSHINAVLQGRVEYAYHLSKSIYLFSALGLNHYSNGAFSKPNFGINIPTASVGVNYHSPFLVPERKIIEPASGKKNFVDFSISTGFRQNEFADQRHYMVNSVSLLGGKKLNVKSSIVVGTEMFLDQSVREKQKSDSTLVGVTFPDTKRASVLVGHELAIGKLSIVKHIGVYIYQPYRAELPFYERIGLKYMVTDKVFAEVDLKAHGFVADVVEWKVGMRF